MSSQLEQNLFHLEGSRKGLDQNSSADSVHGNSDVGLREIENIIPEACFKVMLHFRKVEVGTRAALNELFGVVVEVQCKIEDRTGHRGVVNGNTGFVKMPSPRSGRKCQY